MVKTATALNAEEGKFVRGTLTFQEKVELEYHFRPVFPKPDCTFDPSQEHLQNINTRAPPQPVKQKFLLVGPGIHVYFIYKASSSDSTVQPMLKSFV